MSRLDRIDGHTIKVGQTFYKVFGMPFGFPRLSLREVYELEGPGPRATAFELSQIKIVLLQGFFRVDYIPLYRECTQEEAARLLELHLKCR